MKKQIFASLLASSMILGTLSPVLATIEPKEESPLIAVEQNTLSTNEADFTFKDGAITNYSGSDPVVNIPSTIGGEPVTAINDSAFKYNKSLLTVTIPEGVTEIGYYAFNNCSSLLSVTLPSTLVNVGEGSFSHCRKLTSITLPESVESIGKYAFHGCSTLSNINFPSGLMSIGDYAFRDCDILSSLDIPASVQSIGSSAFYSCDALVKVTLHEGLLSISDSAFRVCSLLTTINLPETLISLGTYVFRACSSLKSITIPSSITAIPADTFNNCTNLSFVSIPDSVTSIGENAFRNCSSLAFLYLPSSIISIGERAFNTTSSSATNMDINLQTVAGSFAESYAISESITYLTVPEDFVPTESSDSNDRVFQTLPAGTKYSSYLTKILDVTDSTTLASGSLPLGLGVYPDGTIGGVPTETGTFEFVVNTTMGEMPYTITVQENTSASVEADNDFSILQRIPTVDNNNSGHVFEVEGEFEDFLHVYLDGVLLVRNVDYTAEEGSTKLNFNANTFAQLDAGDHTVNATFTPTVVSPSTSPSSASSAGVTVEKVAQTFTKTAEKTTAPAMPFEDVEEAHWFYSSVLMMYKQGTFSGVTPTTYEPTTGMTRAMMSMVLYALADKPATAYTNLDDVVEGAWFTDSIHWVVTQGIDDSVGSFRPTDLITREETAQMINNYCTSQGVWLPLVSSSLPNDMAAVSDKAKTHVEALYQRGIFAGDDLGNFNPQNTSTRAEVSTVMRNFMNIIL